MKKFRGDIVRSLLTYILLAGTALGGGIQAARHLGYGGHSRETGFAIPSNAVTYRPEGDGFESSPHPAVHEREPYVAELPPDVNIEEVILRLSEQFGSGQEVEADPRPQLLRWCEEIREGATLTEEGEKRRLNSFTRIGEVLWAITPICAFAQEGEPLRFVTAQRAEFYLQMTLKYWDEELAAGIAREPYEKLWNYSFAAAYTPFLDELSLAIRAGGREGDLPLAFSLPVLANVLRQNALSPEGFTLQQREDIGLLYDFVLIELHNKNFSFPPRTRGIYLDFLKEAKNAGGFQTVWLWDVDSTLARADVPGK